MSSTVLSLVYVPVIYTLMNDGERWLERVLGCLLPEREGVLSDRLSESSGN